MCAAASPSTCSRMAIPKSARAGRVGERERRNARAISRCAGIVQVDLVGNDSGGGIAQIFAAMHPQRVRSLTLTDCDTHDNWPPEAFKPFLAMAAAGGLRDALEAMLADKSVYRSPEALGPAYEDPGKWAMRISKPICAR